MECEKCGKQVDESFNLCPYCGETIEKTKTKSPSKVDFLTCLHCGRPINDKTFTCPDCYTQTVQGEVCANSEKRFYNNLAVAIIFFVVYAFSTIFAMRFKIQHLVEFGLPIVIVLISLISFIFVVIYCRLAVVYGLKTRFYKKYGVDLETVKEYYIQKKKSV